MEIRHRRRHFDLALQVIAHKRVIFASVLLPIPLGHDKPPTTGVFNVKDIF